MGEVQEKLSHGDEKQVGFLGNHTSQKIHQILDSRFNQLTEIIDLLYLHNKKIFGELTSDDVKLFKYIIKYMLDHPNFIHGAVDNFLESQIDFFTQIEKTDFPRDLMYGQFHYFLNIVGINFLMQMNQKDFPGVTIVDFPSWLDFISLQEEQKAMIGENYIDRFVFALEDFRKEKIQRTHNILKQGIGFGYYEEDIRTLYNEIIHLNKESLFWKFLSKQLVFMEEKIQQGDIFQQDYIDFITILFKFGTKFYK